MGTTIRNIPEDRDRAAEGPSFIFHPSFQGPDAETHYGPTTEGGSRDETAGHMPDEETRDWTRRMHYAGYRVHHARSSRDAERWRGRYYACRDRIVLGNYKLIYRAVQRWSGSSHQAEDWVGECQVVLIRAVVFYNPWRGIRFSTYAFTCLMRALSRLARRQATDRLAHSVSLEALPEGEPPDLSVKEPLASCLRPLREYLREGHTLLTPRERLVLIRRFSLNEGDLEPGTLEEVGRELGLSKERVRQVQVRALNKLRRALATTAL